MGRLSLGLCWQTDKVEKISQFKLKKQKKKKLYLMRENFVPTIHSLRKESTNKQTKKDLIPKTVASDDPLISRNV